METAENSEGKRPLGRLRLWWNDVGKRDVEFLNGDPTGKQEQPTGRTGRTAENTQEDERDYTNTTIIKTT